VTEDDDLVVARWPQDSSVELANESLGELKVMRGTSDEILLIQR
jgi:hypothetical protein